jgi:hypothetical protein
LTEPKLLQFDSWFYRWFTAIYSKETLWQNQ